MNICWGFFKWGLLVALIAAIAAVPYFYDRLDNEIRQRVLAILSEQYDGLSISLRAAEFVEDEGIEIRDLVLVETGAAGPRAELLTLPEVFLQSEGTLQEVLSGSIEVREVLVRRPVLRMTRRHDGSWSCSRLLPLPRLGDGKRPLPTIRVEDATVEVFDPTKNPSSTLVLRNVNVVVAAGEGDLQGAQSTCRQITGTLGGDYVSRVELRGQVDLSSGAWSLGGVVDGLEITPESLRSVPEEWLASGEIPESCRARATFQFSLCGGAGEAMSRCRFTAKGTIAEGRIEDPRLPGPLTELAGSFSADNEGVSLSGITARSGPTTFRIHSFTSRGYGSSARKTVDGEVEQLVLDRNLLAALPDRLTETWSKYLPLGQANVKFTADSDGVRWLPRTATVECEDVSFSYHKFPYRLYRVRGTVPQGDDMVALRLENDILQVSLEAFSGKNRVTIAGAVSQPFSAACGEVEIRATELELNDDLFAAMNESSRAVVQSLDPRGRVNAYLRISNERPGEPVHQYLLADVLPGGSIRYARFPYPLAVDSGQIEMIDNQWAFRNFTGTNDTAVVRCSGQFGPGPQGRELALRFDGSSIALDEELRDALSHPNMQRLWNDLRLRGTIDLEDLTVRYLVEPKQLAVNFRAVPDPETTSIEPVSLPYRLEKLRGVLVYEDGSIRVEEFEGSHDEARITAKVTCRFAPDGSWNLRVDDMLVEQLPLDNELARALPDRFRSAITELDTRTPINLSGWIEAGRSAAQIDRLVSQWGLSVVFHRSHLNCGVPIDNVSGKAFLSGSSNGDGFFCRGELENCLLMYRDIQVTQVNGPILIDDQRVLLGARVPPPEGQRPRSLQGSVFGGWVYGDGVAALGKDTGYELSGRLFEADLSRAAQELVSGRQNLKGKVVARADLWGRTKTLNAMEGRGNIQLRNADIYELPVMVSLLKILTIRPPDNKAFSESDIDFQIRGDHVYFPHIVFRGDAISLEGAGEMDANRNVNMRLGTRLGRGDLGMTLLRDVLGGAGDQIVVIHVEGPVSNPKIVRQPLPAVNNLIEQLQKDLQIPVEQPGLFPQTGAMNAYGRGATQKR
ncbi:MAG: hypothetical protein ACYC6Y_11835 [Thermoguttaceae bacterium]